MLKHNDRSQVGQPMATYSLVDQHGHRVDSDQPIELARVVMFWCNHCPYVRCVEPIVLDLARQWQPKGIDFIAICSNDVVAYPDDHPDRMREHALAQSYPFSYGYDTDQSVAKAFNAECTPDFLVFNNKQRCIYHGRLDDTTPNHPSQAPGLDLQTVFKALKAQKPISLVQRPSLGCSIKWRHASPESSGLQPLKTSIKQGARRR